MRIARSKVHFIGIGGVGMSGLAELLHDMGAEVSGSDLHQNPHIEHLVAKGIRVYLGHAAGNIRAADVVVYSSAVKQDNVELVEAKKQKISIIPRAEALAEVMRL